jgi:uncharacterized RDD family membrane protein YckC
MKCPKCGLLNPDTRPQCRQCGEFLQVTETAAVPDWRKEVAEKVKAYGDRKRTLTTPPGPLKEKPVAVDDPPSVPAAAPLYRPDPPKPRRESPKAWPEPAKVRLENPAPPPPEPPKRIFTPPVAASLPQELPMPASETPPAPVVHQELEAWSEDITDLDGEEEVPGLHFEPEAVADKGQPEFLRAVNRASVAPANTLFWRRTGALLIDHVLLIGVYLTIVYVYAAFMQDDVINVAKTAWPALVEFFLLFHLLYYLYFYKTSRQTPGHVFVALELRDPGSVYIPMHKILIRWLVFVSLNILNPLPLLFGKNKFLMDEFSGTEIRSLK